MSRKWVAIFGSPPAFLGAFIPFRVVTRPCVLARRGNFQPTRAVRESDLKRWIFVCSRLELAQPAARLQLCRVADGCFAATIRPRLADCDAWGGSEPANFWLGISASFWGSFDTGGGHVTAGALPPGLYSGTLLPEPSAQSSSRSLSFSNTSA